MSASPSPSPSPALLPYAMPQAFSLGAPRRGTLEPRLPFVPPTWRATPSTGVVSQATDTAEPTEAFDALADISVVVAPPERRPDATSDATSDAMPVAMPDTLLEEVLEAVPESELSSEAEAELTHETDDEDASDSDLPWIENYLESDEERVCADAQDDVDGAEGEASLDVEPEPDIEAGDAVLETRDADASETAAHATKDEVSVDDEAEDWPMTDASADVAALASALPTPTPTPTPSTAPSSTTGPSAAELDVWQDDEAWMDIMPALPNSGTGDRTGDTSWARAFAEAPAPMTPPALPLGDVHAAAASLEAIARRLRAGELEVPGYLAEQGDAAALAATLATLLGARR